ncbi:MAG TPA: hypothetical protein VL426_06330 [Candidatus Binatia bacterium]|jgi:hypothetical protein|nr:hypothetical protein [Candidatus Binatia bacterium]
MADTIVASMLRDQRLDERRREIIERALKAARREQHVARREAGDRAARVVFDRDIGELRITIDMRRNDDGQVAESLHLAVRELGLLVFEVEALRLRLGNGHFRTTVAVRRDIQSYWEMILRYIA